MKLKEYLRTWILWFSSKPVIQLRVAAELDRVDYNYTLHRIEVLAGCSYKRRRDILEDTCTTTADAIAAYSFRKVGPQPVSEVEQLWRNDCAFVCALDLVQLVCKPPHDDDDALSAFLAGWGSSASPLYVGAIERDRETWASISWLELRGGDLWWNKLGLSLRFDWHSPKVLFYASSKFFHSLTHSTYIHQSRI